MDNPFEEINKAREEYVKLVKEKGSQATKDMFKQFFDKHKYVTAISWTQYTPYFNDGDPCVFGINELRFRIDPLIRAVVDKYYNGQPHEEEDDEDEEPGFWDSTDVWSMEECELKTDATVLQGNIWANHDIMLEVFGDHAMVKVEPEEITIEFYNHD